MTKFLWDDPRIGPHSLSARVLGRRMLAAQELLCECEVVLRPRLAEQGVGGGKTTIGPWVRGAAPTGRNRT